MDDIATQPLLPLLTTEEVAAYHRVTTRTIRNWIKRGLLKPVRRSRTVRFRREDVIDFGQKDKKEM